MTHPTDSPVPRLDTPLLTAAEAAELLAVKPSWIYEAVRAGTLPCLRIGRHTRFTPNDARGLATRQGDVERDEERAARAGGDAGCGARCAEPRMPGP
jgi:excisionase family DNA binding protein